MSFQELRLGEVEQPLVPWVLVFTYTLNTSITLPVSWSLGSSPHLLHFLRSPDLDNPSLQRLIQVPISLSIYFQFCFPLAIQPWLFGLCLLALRLLLNSKLISQFLLVPLPFLPRFILSLFQSVVLSHSQLHCTNFFLVLHFFPCPYFLALLPVPSCLFQCLYLCASHVLPILGQFCSFSCHS